MKFKSMAALLLATLVLTGCSDKKTDEPEPVPPTPSVPDEPEKPADILDIPDKEGSNIKGVVYCDGKPLADVVVSDGYAVAKTDEAGRFYIDSDKRFGYVFVSVPSGYMVKIDKGVFPQFYQNTLADRNTVEQINFELVREPSESYVVMYLADMHLAGRNQDEEHYQNWFLKDIKALIKEYRDQGKNVYCMTLGDQSWNTYWYAADIPSPFTLTQTVPYIGMLETPCFNTMGNHDHDPMQALDFEGENFYRREYGPTYYSFNLGKVHYVVLDNIIYDNSSGTLSDECYTARLTPEQAAWLKLDLATLADKSTPVHVLMHSPLYEKPKLNASGNPRYTFHQEDGKELAGILAGFNNVTFFTGHTHVNHSIVNPTYPNIREYNVAAVCATWWWTGKNEYPGNHICRDGSVGGYRVVEVDGKNYRTYFKSIGYPADYQFRTYDVNESRITAPAYCPNSSNSAIKREIEKLTGASGATNTQGSNWHVENKNNEVAINIFAYDPRWKIEVTENGRRLEVTRENAYDPLHLISAMCYRLNLGGKISATFKPSLQSHFFRVKASSATSTLEIRVTDQDGRVFTETMTRPKALDVNMK